MVSATGEAGDATISCLSELELINVDQGPKEIFEDTQLCFYSVKQKQIVFINAFIFIYYSSF
jgi:hypothetical protein